ncbi:MAG: NAD(+) diphosphatase [Bacteroidetes bacterium]|nr:NAD(+) diphosphatase [Bacteroidota bacterium]
MHENINYNINRLSEKRNDEDWIKTKVNDNSSLFIPVFNSLLLFNSIKNFTPVYLSKKEITYNKITINNLIFLGISNNVSYFLFEILDNEKDLLKDYGEFSELRKTLPNLNEFDRNILLYSRAMFYWFSRHKFCGNCGSPNINMSAGTLLKCSNNKCGQSHFPRTDPAVIVHVTKDDKCLLGHNSSWPSNRYSTLAGFVEPGETLEDAVIREVFEESGIIVKNIKYYSSQPWPFPSSLMLGFTAEAVNDKIQIDKNELEHADWFTREEIKKRLIDKTIKMPTRISIAFKLISNWFDKGGLGKLSDISNYD